MAKPPIKIRVSVGKGSMKEVASSQFNQELTELFHQALKRKAETKLEFNKGKLTSYLYKHLSTAYIEAVRQMVAGWMGQLSNYSEQDLVGGPTKLYPNYNISIGTGILDAQRLLTKRFSPSSMFNAKNNTSAPVLWHPLTTQTIRKKAGSKKRRGDTNITSARKFFVHTGSLKTKLSSGIREMVTKTGVVSVTATKRSSQGRFIKGSATTGRYKLYDLKIRLLPNVRGTLPGISTGNWSMDSGTVNFERMLGFDSETLDKLGNTNKGSQGWNMKKRPMLQPIFTYYTLFRAPAVLASGLDEVMKQAEGPF